MSHRLNIGVITRSEQDFYYGVLLETIHKLLCQENCNMFVINTFMVRNFNLEPGKASVYYPLATNHIDGWIVFANGASNEHIEALCKSGKPVVLISDGYTGDGCCMINEDNLFGAQTAVQHLIDHGHKRILLIGWFEVFDMSQRYEGYKQTLTKNGIEFDENLVICVPTTSTSVASKAAMDAVRSGISFTALFATNDQLAIGAIEGLNIVGLRVPEDVAVVGYDNSIYAANHPIGLTSMGQNVVEKGYKAVENILKMIKGSNLSGNNILIKSDLAIRNSCGCKVKADCEEQGTIDIIRSKNLIISSLESLQEKYAALATQLLTSQIDGIKKLIPRIEDNYSWKCTAFWEEGINHEMELYIHEIADPKLKSDLYPHIKCEIEDFPPSSFLPDLNKLNGEEVVWIRPIISSTMNLGILSNISKLNIISSQLAYDNTTILFNLLGNAMDREVANSKLKKTLVTLQQTQEQLINSEKMIALGGLVAGIAHEINTPIGVSVTAASYLSERSEELMGLYMDGKLKRTDMQSYFETSLETIKILSLNLKRASDLINSFKQIAVDQSIEEKRRFKLKEYIDEVLLSLNPKLRKTMIKVSVNCPDDLEIYGQAGALSQIVTNLIVNSLTHAYNYGDTGYITIDIYLEDNMVNFIYSDDGSGIEQKNIGKIFDPFYTTRRGRGGTGLGLNVVYNIVTQEYGGNIKCASEPGKGTVFTIKFPLKEV